jgi:hypothetical protein
VFDGGPSDVHGRKGSEGVRGGKKVEWGAAER